MKHSRTHAGALISAGAAAASLLLSKLVGLLSKYQRQLDVILQIHKLLKPFQISSFNRVQG